MDKEAMKQQILESLSKKLGDGYRISIQKVYKTNLKLDSLAIMQKGDSISPTIYLDHFYKDLENGTALEDVVNGILRDYFHARINLRHFDITYVHDFEQVKNRLYVELINRHSNEELLQDVPHSLFLDDFAVTVRCIVDTSVEESASFLVHNGHLEMWHTDRETLIPFAIQNTRELFGLDLRGIKDVIRELIPSAAEDDDSYVPMWVMTNRRKLSGAATALFDDVLKDFAKTNGSFYVIFSSVHEILLLPDSDNYNIDAITEMNQAVNASEVDADEILGTKAYYYRKDIGFVL